MQKLLLALLIPAILLSSCSIGKKIEQEVSNRGNSETQILIENTKPSIRLSDFSTGSTIKYLGDNFTLSQAEDETRLSYSGEIVKTWSHNPPKEMPYTGAESCEIIQRKISQTTKPIDGSNPNQNLQLIWDSLTPVEKKVCIKEYFWSSIHIESVNKRYYKISRSYYEGADYSIIDLESRHIQDLPGLVVDTLKISSTESGTLLQIDNERGPMAGYRLVFDSDFQNLLSLEEIPWGNSTDIQQEYKTQSFDQVANLGYGFLLSFSGELLSLIDKERVIKNWTLTIPENAPEIYGDECDIGLREDLPTLQGGVPTPEANEAWKSLSYEKKYECMKKKFIQSLIISNPGNSDYFNILMCEYEGGNSELYDRKNGKILFATPSGVTDKVRLNGNILQAVVSGIYYQNMLYTYNTDTKMMISKEIITDDSRFLEFLNN